MMTDKGRAFVERMEIVNAMIKGGTPIFPAMAAGLEDDDWLLVYAAVARMAYDVQHQIPSQLQSGEPK